MPAVDLAKLPLSQGAARAAGVKHYYTGRACKNGHLSHRLTSNGHCVACDRIHAEKWRAANPDTFKAVKKAWRDANVPRLSAYRSSWRQENLERDNTNLKRWMKENPGRLAAAWAKRRALRQQAKPAWADLAAIRKVYEDARAQGLHVDHIIPLRGKNVCGLHVANNLQLLTPSANRLKHNKFDADMFDELFETQTA